MERGRMGALGARHMDGMRGNLAASLAMRMRGDPISRAQNREDVPISSALELMLREALTGEQAPQGTETGLSLVRDWISSEAGGDLTALSMLLDDQAAFADTAKLALRHLDLIHRDAPSDDGPEDGARKDETEDAERQEEQERERKSEVAGKRVADSESIAGRRSINKKHATTQE